MILTSLDLRRLLMKKKRSRYGMVEYGFFNIKIQMFTSVYTRTSLLQTCSCSKI